MEWLVFLQPILSKKLNNIVENIDAKDKRYEDFLIQKDKIKKKNGKFYKDSLTERELIPEKFLKSGKNVSN